MRGFCSRPSGPIHREDSPSWTRRFASVNSSPRWRSRRTTRSDSRSSLSCARACSRRRSARPQGSTTSCARPRTGWRCCATSAAPATPTRSPPSSATRSRSAPRRSCTTPRIPTEVMRDVMAFATAGRSPEEQDAIVKLIQETAKEWAVYNFSSGCEVADMLLQRLDFGPDVREAIRFTFERWNGNGYPAHAQGRGDPARDARGAPQPRHGGDRPPVLDRPRHRGRPRSPRPHVRPGSRRPVRRAWARLARSAQRDRSVGRRARARARTAPRAVRRAARRRPDRRRRLHRPQVAVHGRPQPSLRRARSRRLPRARARRGGRHQGSPRGARARLRNHGRAELDLGQARAAHAHGVRPRRASPAADRADAAPLAGAGRPEPRRVRAPREGRRVRVPQARAGRRRRPRRVRPGGDGGLRGDDHRAGRPPAVLARGRGRRASRARISAACSSRARAARCSWPRGTASREGALGQAASTIRADSPGARSTCCDSRPGDSRRARSPTGSRSPPRPPITTSSTSTARSARRREPAPRSGPCSTPSSSKRLALNDCGPPVRRRVRRDRACRLDRQQGQGLQGLLHRELALRRRRVDSLA